MHANPASQLCATTDGRWNPRPALLLIGVIAAMYFGREFLIPLAFAVVLSLLWSPVVAWLQKRHFPRAPAVFTVALLSIVCGGVIGWVILNQLLAVVNELPDYKQNINDKIAALRVTGNASVGRAAANVQRLGKELSTDTPLAAPKTAGSGRPARPPASEAPTIPVEVVQKPPNALEYVGNVAWRFLGPVGIAALVLIFSVFLLINQQDVRNRFLRLFALGHLSLMTTALEDATGRVSRYLLLQLSVNAGFGLTIGLGLYCIGVPYAVLWGTLAGFLRFVPYVGTLVAGIFPLLLSVGVFSGWWPLLWVFLLFLVVEVVVGNWIEPKLYGAYTGVSALAILITTAFWTILWGPAGLILSTPLTVCAAVIGRYVPGLHFLHILLGDEEVLAAETQIYQRLLAMDREEAREIAELFLKEGSLLELYERVLVPALALAEHDRHRGLIDSKRETFLFLSVKEMIAELAEGHPQPVVVAPDPSALRNSAESKLQTFAGRVLCVPASDEADEIVGTMLVQLLISQEIAAEAFPADVNQALDLLEPSVDDLILISALPPFAFAQAKALSVQLGLRFPRTKTGIAIWGFEGDTAKALERFGKPRPQIIIKTLSDALAYFRTGSVSVARLDQAPPESEVVLITSGKAS